MLNHYHFLDSARDGKRPITFSRYAGPGSHRYPIGFSGDTVPCPGFFEAARGVEHVPEQRSAGQRLQHLWQVGIHSLALASSQDDDGKGHGKVRVWRLRDIVPKRSPEAVLHCAATINLCLLGVWWPAAGQLPCPKQRGLSHA